MIQIRRGQATDIPQLTGIYNHYIRHTPITFDIEEKSEAARREWFAQFSDTGRHQLFVAEIEGACVGHACSARFEERAAYAPSVEASIYLAPEATGQGLGRRLYDALFAAIANEDVHRIYAGITLPNPASVKLHEHFGFDEVGLLHEVGRKFGKYWDVCWMERRF